MEGGRKVVCVFALVSPNRVGIVHHKRLTGGGSNESIGLNCLLSPLCVEMFKYQIHMSIFYRLPQLLDVPAALAI